MAFGRKLRIERAVFPDVALRGYAQVNIGIFGMGFGTPGADVHDQCGRLTTVLQVIAIALAGLEAGTIAGVEHGFAGIGDEHDRAPDDINELVFVRMPMTLAGPGARTQLQQINAELGKVGQTPRHGGTGNTEPTRGSGFLDLTRSRSTTGFAVLLAHPRNSNRGSREAKFLKNPGREAPWLARVVEERYIAAARNCALAASVSRRCRTGGLVPP